MTRLRRGRRSSGIDVHVGRRVKLRRLELGLSQEALGERLGVSFQQVQKYERGTNRIGASRLFEMAGILRVDIAYFYFDADKALSEHQADRHDVKEKLGEFVASSEGAAICRAFMLIKDAGTRKRIIKLLKSLSEQ